MARYRRDRRGRFAGSGGGGGSKYKTSKGSGAIKRRGHTSLGGKLAQKSSKGNALRHKTARAGAFIGKKSSVRPMATSINRQKAPKKTRFLRAKRFR